MVYVADISNQADTIDILDVIDRVEELRGGDQAARAVLFVVAAQRKGG